MLLFVLDWLVGSVWGAFCAVFSFSVEGRGHAISFRMDVLFQAFDMITARVHQVKIPPKKHVAYSQHLVYDLYEEYQVPVFEFAVWFNFFFSEGMLSPPAVEI